MKVLVLILFFALTLSGCTLRTYQLTRDRVDQGITGNRGYLQGEIPSETKDRKTTRTTQVFEIEMRPLLKFEEVPEEDEGLPVPVAMPQQTRTPSDQEAWGNRGVVSSSTATEESVARYEKYTVQKGESLQKISKKLYGTTKKWSALYDINKDTLKGPNKVYPGEVINVFPRETKPSKLMEPKENLK